MKKTKQLTLTALLGAIAFMLIFFNFPIPFLSPFAELDLSAVPELIGGFMMGPVGATGIITVKLLLKLLFQGSSSMLTGEVQNFILECTFVIPAALYYRKHKTKKGAVIGLVIGAVISVIASVFTNVYLIFPAYIRLYGMNWDSILGMFNEINPMIKNIPTMVAFSVIPFNLVSRIITSVITMILYKKISKFIKGKWA